MDNKNMAIAAATDEQSVSSDTAKKTQDLADKGPIERVSSVQEGSSVPTIDPKAERALVWKLDLHVLPVLAVMYFWNALDKTNMGNAKTIKGSQGLLESLHMSGQQYNTMLSIFYVPYVLTAPFLAILGKKYGPARVLPLMMATFGSMTLLTTAVQNFAGIMTLRWFLGMAESAFFPLVIYYQTTFYRRGELARRLAIFYAAQSIAGAFGGLLAYGVFHIQGSDTFQTWRYLFAIEGSCTIAFAAFAYWYLPHSASRASFLSEDQKELALQRMQVDSSSIVNEKFNLRSALSILRHPTSWVILGIEICLGVPLQSLALFLPQIIARLGYNTVLTNLLTVAPNVGGAVMLLILAFASDMLRIRFPFIALGFLFTLLGFVIYAAVDVTTQLHVAYFACFMMTWGSSAPSVILDVWYNNNIANENKRVLLTSLGVPAANLMGVVSSNIFLPGEAPKYETALITTACFGGCGCALTLALGAYMIWDNRKRDRTQGVWLRAKDVSTAVLADGPAVDEYRWFL